MNACVCVCVCLGTFAVVSIMVGSVTEKFGPDSDFVVGGNGTNGTAVVDVDVRDAYRVQISCALTAVVGVLQVHLRFLCGRTSLSPLSKLLKLG